MTAQAATTTERCRRREVEVTLSHLSVTKEAMALGPRVVMVVSAATGNP